ncbi:MAG: double-strand break repair protein AddB [Minwuia sp.]|uniref:double-strand break repair protein AddB n=1 Tax=Minwuia sp. TaxID=2493630 RepID=UPI003A862CDB
MGRVATIPAGRPFVDLLAREMLARHGAGGDGSLADALVLVPTRRAVRSLSQAFLRAGEGQALLLPAIQPLGDIDDDEPAMLSPDRAAEAELPPAVDPVTRRMLLAQLVLKRDPESDAATAFGLAQSLGDMLDEVLTERLDFVRLKDLAPERFQIHWQETIDFLQIVTGAWPTILNDLGAVDAAARRDMLAARLAAHWRETPPETPVWIAGSTGSIPATADLMQAVLAMPKGAVVLPGFDRALDERDREAALAEPVHPQHGMLTLLRRLGVDPSEVADLGEGGIPPRQALLTEALRPASTTERWGDLKRFDKAALDGLSVIVAPGLREEAAAISVRLREVLESPGRTAALVTPDRNLARRVAAEMARYGVRLDDSAGAPLRLTRAGGFLQLAAVALSDGFAPADLLALLKHPLAAVGLAAPDFRRQVRRLERRHLRGIRHYDELEELAERAADDAGPWLGELAAHARAFRSADGDLGSLVRAHAGFCEWLASTDEADSATRLWRGDDGEAAAGAISAVLGASGHSPAVTAAEYAASFDRLVGGATVRPRFGLHPRLQILGPLEARLQSFDLVVLGGLNEGVWPAAAGNDPWMSRPMRADFGLPSPERRTGLQAHDFLQLAAAPNVILTRSAKADGSPTVPSRWLLRLESVAKGAGLELVRDKAPLDWAGRLDRTDTVQPVNPPTPRPPASARPVELPVTAVETLIRDPYAIFARRILGLRALDPLDEEPGPRHRGNILHAAFEELAKIHTGDWSPDLMPALEKIGEQVFDREGLPPSWRALWMRRFRAAGQWLLRTEAERPDRVAKRLVEAKGLVKGLPGLPDFTLTAKADRLDVLAKGTVTIADYKTGQLPTRSQIDAGFAVQLPLTAFIAATGGFGDDVPVEIDELVHIRVHGSKDGGEWKPVKTDDLGALIAETRDGVATLLADYAEAERPYLSRPHVQFARDLSGDYDHLARVAEWSVAGGEEGET